MDGRKRSGLQGHEPGSHACLQTVVDAPAWPALPCGAKELLKGLTVMHIFQGTQEEPPDDATADDGYNPAEGKSVSAEELKERTDQFNADINSRMKDRGDLFDEMVVHEEQIRLGEEGWKLRYYEVSLTIMTAQQ